MFQGISSSHSGIIMNMLMCWASDVYHMDYEQKDYTDLVDLGKGKLVALTECGELPSTTILQVQPKWSWFLVWNSFINELNNSKRHVNEIYNCHRY